MSKSRSGGAFGVLQRVGRSFMFPIALLPVAGLLLGIGSSFSNPTTIELYNLQWLLGEGTILNIILSIMAATGNVIFGNLPLIFAMGVALGMAKQEKEIATLSAAVAFLVMHMTIATLLNLTGRIHTLQEGATGNVLGLTSLEIGVFGGIIVGLGVAWLHNRFYKIELPNAISFFGGTRFIPLTGVTLPLISMGGSSLCATLLMFGVVQGIYIKEFAYYEEDYEEDEFEEDEFDEEEEYEYEEDEYAVAEEEPEDLDERSFVENTMPDEPVNTADESNDEFGLQELEAYLEKNNVTLEGSTVESDEDLITDISERTVSGEFVDEDDYIEDYLEDALKNIPPDYISGGINRKEDDSDEKKDE